MPADPPYSMPVERPRDRWAELPGDPPALRREMAWRRRQAAGWQDPAEYPGDWPQESS